MRGIADAKGNMGQANIGQVNMGQENMDQENMGQENMDQVSDVNARRPEWHSHIGFARTSDMSGLPSIADVTVS